MGRFDPMTFSNAPAARARGTLHVALFCALACGIVFIAAHSWLEERRIFRAALYEQLDEIATSKNAGIFAWQLQRTGNAAVTARSAVLIPDVIRTLGGDPAPAAASQAAQWLEQIRETYRYDNAALLDASGAIRVSTGRELAPPGFYQAIGQNVAADGKAVSKYYPGDSPGVQSQFMFCAPLRSGSGAIAGSVLLTLDPWVYPFPALLKWPSPSRSGVVWMVRREGQNVRALGFGPGPAGKRIESITSLSLRDSPLVKAVAVRNGIVDGTSAAGAGSAAVARAMTKENSSPVMLAMIDETEAYQPLRQTRTLLILSAGLLIALCGVGVGWIWRRQVLESSRQRVFAENERRELAERYDYMTRFANDAVFLARTDGTIVQANERGSEFYGYTRDEFLGMNKDQLRGPGTEAAYERARVAIEEKGSFVYETTGVRKDGTTFPVELSTRMVEVDGEQYRQTIVRDITERRRDEGQIRRLNRLYAVLSRCGQAIVKAPDENALFREVCHVAAESGGFRIAAICAADNATGCMVSIARAGEASAYLDERPCDSSVCSIAKCGMREGESRVCNDIREDPSLAAMKESALRYDLRSFLVLPLRRGGRLAGEMCLYSAEPNFFNAEEIELATEIAESICFALESLERKRQQQAVEAELRVNRERLELVLDATEEAYWDWDLESGAIQQSPRYDTMLGYRPFELKREFRTWLSMVHPEDAGPIERELADFRTSGKSALSMEFRMRGKSGEYIWISGRGKIVDRDAAGKPRRMVGTLTDVTDRKKLEEQFRQAQKLESVGRLAGGIAHDFNNLLTVINGYSGLLVARTAEKDPKRRQLQEIRKAGERAAELTRQLLTFSRKQVTQPRLLKLNESVSDSAEMLHRLVPETVEFRTLLDAEPDEVITDPSQVHQILMNLVVNASDAMPDGGSLTIRTANVHVHANEVVQDSDVTSGPYVLLSVTDTGTGMDDETLRHIFEPFFTTKDVGKGTGLGLSTVYGIARQCGGFVRVESALGKGTTFKVHFPLAAEGIRPQAMPASTRDRDLRGSETILVVEDQESVRNLAAETLRTYGYAVIPAQNGPDALDLVRRHPGPIHLLLTDVSMPSMNGHTVAQEVRAFSPATKVVYMSGYADDIVRGTGELAPDVAYLQKPFAPEALAVKVRQTLMRPAETRPAEACPTETRPTTMDSIIQRTILVVEDEEGVRDLVGDLLGGRHRVLLAKDGLEALRILRERPEIDIVITDLVMPNQEGIEVIRAARKMRPEVRIVAMSGAFAGQFLKTAELLGADATLVKPIRPEVLDQVIEDVFARV